MSTEFKRLLFLQKKSVLKQHKNRVINFFKENLPELDLFFATSIKEIPDVSIEIIIGPTVTWLPEVLKQLEDVKWIHFLSAGVDAIWDMDFDKSKYMISKSSGVHAETISEYIIASIFYKLKNFDAYRRQQRNRDWNRYWSNELSGKTIGIIGVGSIGKMLAEKLKVWDVKVIGSVNEVREIPNVDEIYSSDSLSPLVSRSDFIVVTLPYTNETEGLIDYNLLKNAKGNSILVNVSRGGVVKDNDLIRALKEEKLSGAILDVFESEPLPEKSPFWSMPNVLVTPHIAGTTNKYMSKALNLFKKNLEEFRDHGLLKTPVNVNLQY